MTDSKTLKKFFFLSLGSACIGIGLKLCTFLGAYVYLPTIPDIFDFLIIILAGTILFYNAIRMELNDLKAKTDK